MSEPAASGYALYVYYKVPCACLDAARVAVQAMQAQAQQAFPGLRAGLLQRVDAPLQATDPITWMETYEHPAGLDASLEAWLAPRVQALPFEPVGGRHAERFCALAVPPQPERG